LKTYYLVMIDKIVDTEVLGEDGAIGSVRVLFPDHVLDGEIFSNHKNAEAVWRSAKDIDENVVIKKVQVF